MLNSKLIWKMAWEHLRKQKRQTLLSIIGGFIGAALLTTTVVVYQSFEYSGQDWVERHFDSIGWEVRPSDHLENPYLTPQDLAEVQKQLGPEHPGLPTVNLQTSAVKLTKALEQEKVETRLLVIGVDYTQVAKFDTDHKSLWDQPLRQDEVILSEPVANFLGVTSGEVIGILDATDQRHLFKVQGIVPESGLTGYRGEEEATGTIFANASEVRDLAGVPEGMSNRVLVQSRASETTFPVTLDDKKFKVSAQKARALDKLSVMKIEYGIKFAYASLVAGVCGILLMLQLLLMLAESRMEHYGILRAIGFNNRKILSIFLVEATLLNAFCTLTGLVTGSAFGYGMIEYFRRNFGETMQRAEGSAIPIIPHIGIPGVLIAGVCTMILLTAVAGLAGRRVSQTSIPIALKGHANVQQTSTKRKLPVLVFSMLAILAIGIHAWQWGSGQYIELSRDRGTSALLLVFLLALVGSIGCLYLILLLLPRLDGVLRPVFRLLGFRSESLIFAVRYPAQERKRTFNVAFQFSILFMILTITVTAISHSMGAPDAEHHSPLGFKAYIRYADDAGREKLLKTFSEDALLREKVSNLTTVEPLRFNVHMDDVVPPVFSVDFTALPANEAYVQNGSLELVERGHQYDSDRSAWEALQQDPDAIILDESYRNNDHNMDGKRALKLGDTFNLYNVKNEKILEKKVIGFKKSDPAIPSTFHFLGLMFLSPSSYEEMKVYNAKFPNLKEQGYVMFNIEDRNFETVNLVETNLTKNGMFGLEVPYVREAAQGVINQQNMQVFTVYILLSAVTAIMGLMIIQFRAVQVRAKQMAMLRCMGLSNRTILQIFWLESILVTTIGLVNGLLFGLSSGYMLTKALDPKPLDAIVRFPAVTIALLGVLLLLCSLVLNLAPARLAVKLKPGEAIRAANL